MLARFNLSAFCLSVLYDDRRLLVFLRFQCDLTQFNATLQALVAFKASRTFITLNVNVAPLGHLAFILGSSWK